MLKLELKLYDINLRIIMHKLQSLMRLKIVGQSLGSPNLTSKANLIANYGKWKFYIPL